MKHQQSIILVSISLCVGLAYFLICPPKPVKSSIWIDTFYPNDSNHLRTGRYYNDLIKLNDKQFLFLGKDGLGNTFDSSIITVNQ